MMERMADDEATPADGGDSPSICVCGLWRLCVCVLWEKGETLVCVCVLLGWLGSSGLGRPTLFPPLLFSSCFSFFYTSGK